MAEKNLHIIQARHNKRAAKYLLKNNCTFPDWAIICAFYAALHCFEACLYERENDHSESLARREGLSPHVFRNEFIHDRHILIFQKWKSLYNECRVARYLIDLEIPAYEFYSKNHAEELIRKMDEVRYYFGYQF